MIDNFPEQRAATLIANRPEFKTAGPLAIAAIRFALPQINEDVWGDKADIAVELLAADYLATSPYGVSLRGDDDGKPTRYRIEYDALKLQVLPRMMVL